MATVSCHPRIREIYEPLIILWRKAEAALLHLQNSGLHPQSQMLLKVSIRCRSYIEKGIPDKFVEQANAIFNSILHDTEVTARLHPQGPALLKEPHLRLMYSPAVVQLPLLFLFRKVPYPTYWHRCPTTLRLLQIHQLPSTLESLTPPSPIPTFSRSST
jgi:hypothetical protein